MTTPKLPPTPGPRCGTRAGSHRHRDLGERACQPCRDAENRHQQARSISTGRVQRIQIPAPVLAAILTGQRDPVRTLTGFLGPEVVQALCDLDLRGEQR